MARRRSRLIWLGATLGFVFAFWRADRDRRKAMEALGPTVRRRKRI